MNFPYIPGWMSENFPWQYLQQTIEQPRLSCVLSLDITHQSDSRDTHSLPRQISQNTGSTQLPEHNLDSNKTRTDLVLQIACECGEVSIFQHTHTTSNEEELPSTLSKLSFFLTVMCCSLVRFRARNTLASAPSLHSSRSTMKRAGWLVGSEPEELWLTSDYRRAGKRASHISRWH